ncbi:MAG: hypothetical protein Q4D07_02980 [Selenomonadaceae bacterium]|nr:hypothetical protein [Selenomonadaceae bacterium]
MAKQFIYVDTRQQVAKVDGAAYYTVYKFERELTAEETDELTRSKEPKVEGMVLPKNVKVSEYADYVKKHEGRGDVLVELPIR